MKSKSAARVRYAIVGTGGRAGMYIEPLATTYRPVAELVGLCDLSQTRLNFWNGKLATDFHHSPVPTYRAGDFDRLVREQKPAVVIVCSMDCTHHEYIIRTMQLGCDVISEKPMTIDAAKANAIFAAIKSTGRSLRVTFNYRYAPVVTKVYELLRQGAVGQPLAVDFSWVLDTSHGADYFRRWHREKDKSGGLLVHKSTHHFDLINWWLGSFPATVYAMGGLKFYGHANATARGEKYDYPRYTGAAGAHNDPFALTLEQDAPFGGASLKALYRDAEADSGYIRDRNVFGDNITIEDTLAVTARYRNGVIFNYSLIAYSPWEGYRVAITGTKGRLELYDKHGAHIIAGPNDTESSLAQARAPGQQLRVFPMFGIPYDVAIPQATGGHGGGDPLLQEQLFSPTAPADPFGRTASHIDGAASILLGIAANQSLATGLPVQVDDLLKLPTR